MLLPGLSVLLAQAAPDDNQRDAGIIAQLPASVPDSVAAGAASQVGL